MEGRLSPRQRDLVRSPPLVLSVAFGTAYAACSDTQAACIAVLIAGVFLSMYDDLVLPDPVRDPSPRE
jgi:hypothetical protein